MAAGKMLEEPVIMQVSTKSSYEISLDSKLGKNFKCGKDKMEFFENEIMRMQGMMI